MRVSYRRIQLISSKSPPGQPEGSWRLARVSLAEMKGVVDVVRCAIWALITRDAIKRNAGIAARCVAMPFIGIAFYFRERDLGYSNMRGRHTKAHLRLLRVFRTRTRARRSKNQKMGVSRRHDELRNR